jgi:hypothetical protein
MRLDEFTDPSTYISTDADTKSLLRQIERLWSANLVDDDIPFPIRPRQRRQNERAKPSDER